MHRSAVRAGPGAALAAFLTLSACGRLSGFESFTAASSDGAGGSAGTTAGSSNGGSAGSSDAGSAGSSSLPDWSPSCFDNTRNNDETDVDCGGSCPRCARDRDCLSDGDCWNDHCVLGACSTTCPPDMGVFRTEKLETFCVDDYEVTQAQYAAFLATSPSRGRQTPACAKFNGSFVPHTTPSPGTVDDGHADCTPNAFLPTDPTSREEPVVCIDWCDAVAYCLAHGKFLCGDALDPDQPLAGLESGGDAFFIACTSGDEKNAYPYGSDYSPKTCNGLNYSSTIPSLLDVGATAGCVSGNSSGRAYNLVGNASEWSNACKTSTDQCVVRGGSFLDGKDGTCKHAVPTSKTDAFADVGFRCCGLPSMPRLALLALLTACSVDQPAPVDTTGTSGSSGQSGQVSGGSGGQAGDTWSLSGSSGQASAGAAGAPSGGGSGGSGAGGAGGASSGPVYAASCFDGHLSEGETDVDCGGDCPRCHQEQACTQASDCWNGDCTAAGTCSAVCPSGMAAYEPEPPAKPFCVAMTEVTQAQYAAFLATGPSLGRQRPLCQLYNTSFAPHDSSPATMAQCTPGSYRPTETPQRPVACVDWCDADAYCREQGLHLCGSITSPGTGLEFGQDQTLTTDQWYFACTEGDDDNEYVYGEYYEPDACTGRDAFASDPHSVDVGSVTTCRAAPGRPLDLNGNVSELVNELIDVGTSGSAPAAKTSGGSFFSTEKEVGCASFRGISIDLGSPQVGFRCCGS